VPQATVSREVARLVEAGILAGRDVGRTRLVRPRVESPIHGELEALLIKVAGPPAVLGEVLADIPGIDQAYIYGSWARRHRGEAGDEPADIDVLLVADGPDPLDTARRARTAADTAVGRLGRDVTISVLTSAEWADGQGGFVRAVRESPLVPIEIGRRP
jgi:hypothetical protein